MTSDILDREILVELITKEVLTALSERSDICKNPEAVRQVLLKDYSTGLIAASGLIALMFPGVRPSIRLASRPIPMIRPDPFSTATTEGSFRMIPRPCTQTSVFAVPRSIPISVEKMANWKASRASYAAHTRRMAGLRWLIL